MLTRRSFLLTSFATASAVILTPQLARAGQPEAFATNGIAINGYDPVAYFTDGKPVEGDPSITSDWMGSKIQFANAEHKAMFDADPEKFGPKYGGYCAYAVSKGYTATTDPGAWAIFEDRLYLNYSKSVRALWSLNKGGHVRSANANWPGVLDN